MCSFARWIPIKNDMQPMIKWHCLLGAALETHSVFKQIMITEKFFPNMRRSTNSNTYLEVQGPLRSHFTDNISHPRGQRIVKLWKIRLGEQKEQRIITFQ